MISSQLLFLFSCLGAVNAIFLALYLFSRRSNRLTNNMLGALLLAIGFRTGKSAFYYFNPDIAGGFIQLGLSACLFIGPLTYLYVRCHLADLSQISIGKQWRWHLLPPLCAISVGMFFPYSNHPVIWRCSIVGIHLYWLSYLLLAGRQLWQSRALLARIDGRVSRPTILLLSVYFSSFLILVAYVITPLTSYIVGALSFTFAVHVTVLTYVLHNDAKVDVSKKEKYLNRKLTDEDAIALVGSLDQLMREERLYLNPGLSLALLAKKAGSLQTTVSQAINENLGKSFNLYINEFRIQHAKKLLVSESHLNMELVAERSGFNSNSTFFAAFKKLTGQTPASYRAAYASAAVSAAPETSHSTTTAGG